MKGSNSFIAFGLIALFAGLWELMHQWWFWTGLVAVVALFYLGWGTKKPYTTPTKSPSLKRPESLEKEAEFDTPTLPDLSAYEPRLGVDAKGMMTMSLPDGELFPKPTGDAQLDFMTREHLLDAWDAARKKLQQIAYGMVSETPQTKAEFTRFMKVFAGRDPLLSSVLNTVLPLVQDQPGVLQTATYKHLPGIAVEEVRYAIYFAEQLGMLRREKKGNTYRLLPIGDVIDVDSVAPGHASQSQ